MIAVFAYAFAHRKTQDFLIEIALAGHRKVTVFAAPFQKLKQGDSTRYWTNTLETAPALETAQICSRLGFEYVEAAHNDVDTINKHVTSNELTIGVVSGARILKRDVIKLFSDGIVNFHPGAIPETSGLDAFFYTIKTGTRAGVTTHFIDPRVDAGQFLDFDPVSISPLDSPETVQAKVYQIQIVALRRFLTRLADGDLEGEPINRPAANRPMDSNEKLRILARFPQWRTAQCAAQDAQRLLTAAAVGETNKLMEVLDVAPHLLETRSPEGWTPLIVAAHGQHRETVRVLLDRGADPNATGAKGTTVLMYAKTELMKETKPDTSLLDMLIAAGADLSRHDMHGRDISYYVAGHPILANYVSAKRD